MLYLIVLVDEMHFVVGVLRMRPLKRRGFGGRAGQSGGATWCGQLYSPPDFLEAGKYCAAGLYRPVSDTRLCLDNARVFPYNSFAVGCCVADRGVGMAGVAGWGLGMWLAANRRIRGVGHKQHRLVPNLAIHYYIAEVDVGRI